MRVLITIFIMIMSAPSKAQELVTQTARDKIDITVGFVGSSIEVFGDRSNSDQEVAIVVEGPEVDITIWKKARVLGAWVNANSVKFKKMPSYYQFATSLDLRQAENKRILRQNGIGHDALFDKSPTRPKDKKDIEIFQTALKDKKRREQVFFAESEKVKFLNENFFRVHFDVPASAPTGDYKIHSYLLENGKAVQHDINVFKVEQVGLNAFIFDAAHKYSTLYALTCVILAVFSGWLVSVLRVKP